LQGLTFDKQRADILKSKQYKNFYSTERIILLNNLFFEAGVSYAEWAYAHKLMSLTTYYTLLAKQRLSAMNDLASIGERAAADTVEAAIFYQTRLLDYNIAKVEALEKATQVSNFYLNNQLINFTNGIKPTDTLDILFEKIKEKTMLLLREDSLNNPILNQYQTKQNIFEIEKRFRKEMIKPKLSINYNLISESQGNTLAQLSTNNYKWGASLNFPLLFRNTYNSFKIADLDATNNKMELDFKKLEIQYKNNLLKQTISVLSEQIVAAIKNVNYSKILLDAEKLKFNIGESSLFLLNTRENKLMETELKLAEYKLKYLKTVLKLIHLNGNLNYQL
jgi:outer membrane protein TolC